jgi:lipopolysaccharide assembly outer membrane protein LptD (OstA)
LAGFALANWERTREAESMHLEEMILGVEYDGCCWHLQLAGQRTVNEAWRESSRDQLFDTIILTVTLKGLGRVGRRNNLLESVTDQLPGQSSPVFMTE